MEHSPYSCSSHMAPNDLWLFPKINSTFKGQRFKDIEYFKKKNVTASLKTLAEQEFQKSSHQWHHRWDKYISVQREYLECEPSH